MKLSEKGTEILIVLLMGIAVVLTFVLITNYDEGQVLPYNNGVSCEKYCPVGCDCFFRSDVCRISSKC